METSSVLYVGRVWGFFDLTVRCSALLVCQYIQVTGLVWLLDPSTILPPFCICKVVHVGTSLSSFRSENETDVL